MNERKKKDIESVRGADKKQLMILNVFITNLRVGGVPFNHIHIKWLFQQFGEN